MHLESCFQLQHLSLFVICLTITIIQIINIDGNVCNMLSFDCNDTCLLGNNFTMQTTDMYTHVHMHYDACLADDISHESACTQRNLNVGNLA